MWFLMLFTYTGKGQSKLFQNLGKVDGLENAYNDFISKDSRGFLWISSINGGYYFDGIELKSFANSSRNNTLLKGDIILSSFYEDETGNLWFSTNAGINQYIRSKDTFIPLSIVGENKQPITGDFYLFHLERDSILWFQANKAIYTYHIAEKKSKKIIESNGVRFAVDTLENGKVSKIFSCFWMFDSGLDVITIQEDQSATKVHYLKTDEVPNLPGKVEVISAIVGTSNQLWLLSDRGLLEFDLDCPDIVKPYPLSVDKVDYKFFTGAMLNNNYLLLGGKNTGLYLFNTKSKHFEDSYLGYQKDEQTTNRHIRKIFFDREDNLWISLNGTFGIDYNWVNQNQFQNPFQSQISKLPDVAMMLEDWEGNIWCATQDAGIYQFLGKDDQVKHFPYDPLGTNGGFSIREVKQISMDQKGQVWALGKRHLLRYDAKRKNWKEKFKVVDKELFFLHHLSANKKIISTNNGIVELKKKGGGHLESTGREVLKENTYSLVHFYENQYDHVFVYAPFGTKILRIYQSEADSLIFFKEFVCEGAVNTIWEDQNRQITWVGTSKGLYQMNTNRLDTLQAVLDTLNFSPQQIYEIVGDRNRKLWISASDGLWSYHPEAGAYHQFGIEDGLNSDKFSLFSSLATKDGEIWFGTDKGVIAFDPNKIKPNPHGASAFIYDLRINGSIFSSSTTLNELKDLRLNADQNNLVFELRAISHYFPKRNKVTYRLKNYEENWNLIENGKTAVYNQIPPGKYTLEIFGLNANGTPGEKKILRIHISKPYWQAWWFWVIVGLVLGLVVSFAFWLQFQRQLQEQKALQDERNRIAKDLHDDIGSGLSRIRFISEDMRNSLSDQKENDKLEKIHYFSVSLIGRMRDIIWTMNDENSSLEDLLFSLRREASEYLHDNQIECDFVIPEEIPQLELTREQRRNILLTIKEALHNIVKHAQAVEVKIRITIDHSIKVTIQDNGTGFDLNILRGNGNGLKNMPERIQNLGGTFTMDSSNQGTFIKFSIPLPQLNT